MSKGDILARRAAELARTTGLPVFPVLDDKTPATRHGYKDAVSDPNAAYRLFRRHPSAMLIGVPTGKVSNLAVIDIDPQGMQWFQQHISRFPPTRVHTTRRNGRHLFYQLPVENIPPFKCSVNKIARGIDTRGEGGSIIWWPASGGSVVHDVETVRCPPWILRRLYREPMRHGLRASGGVGGGEGGEAGRVAGGLDALLRFVARSPNGERNSRLFWACIKAAAAGSDCHELINAAVAGGVPYMEARRTALSGIRTARRAA